MCPGPPRTILRPGGLLCGQATGQMAQRPENRHEGKGRKVGGGADGHKEPRLTTGGPRRPFAVTAVREEVVNLHILLPRPTCHPGSRHTGTAWCLPDRAGTEPLLAVTSALKRGDRGKPQLPGVRTPAPCRRLVKPLRKVHYPRFLLRAKAPPLSLCRQMRTLIGRLSVAD